MSARAAPTAVVVGAGLAGLSAALHLAGAGVQVTIVEQEPVVGGRAPVSEVAGARGTYRLDTGPTVLTEEPILSRCFAAVGEDLADWLTLHRLDPAYHARFADGTELDLVSDPHRMRALIDQLAGPQEAAGYDRFVRHVSRLYDTQLPTFIDRNLDGPADLLRPELVHLAALRGFGRLAPLVASFFGDPRLQRAFSFQALYAGVAPARALGLFAVISAMDLVHGVSYPAGGMSAVPEAMAAAAEAHGVQIALHERVEHITRSGERHQVDTDARTLVADAVVLTAEPEHALPLLGRRATPVQPSPSCVLLAAGLRHRLPEGSHHTICFGQAWEEVFEDLHQGRLMRDPSFLVSVPSRTDRSLAPPGGEVLYALFPAPALDRPGCPNLDWDRLTPLYREQMLHHLQEAGFGPLDLDVETLITPAGWRERGMPYGTPFSAAHTFGQSGPFRRSNDLGPGLALAGSGTTPGVGIPMVLISGRLAAQRVLASVGDAR